MSFPQDPLTVLVEVALGADVTADPGTWSWTDVTDFIYTRDSITITRGRADQSAIADTSTLTMTADNRDGRWSSRNPNGAWYGLLRIGTPVRVSAEGHVRFTGFLSSLPPRWDVSGRDRYAPLEAKGLLYRLGRSSTPIKSPLRRSISFAEPTAYWPMEEGTDATVLASATGGPNLLIDGGAPGTGLVALGASGAISFADGGQAYGPTGIASGTTQTWEFSVVVGWDTFPTLVGSNFGTVLHLATPSSALIDVGLILVNDVRGGEPDTWQLGVFFTDASDGSIGVGVASERIHDIQPGLTYHVRVTFEENGGNARLTMYLNGDADSSAFTNTGAPLPALPTHVILNFLALAEPGSTPIGQAFPGSVSHLAIWVPMQSTDETYLAAGGFDGEQAHERFERLCDEDGIVNTTNASESQLMGAQGIDTFLNVVRQPEATDQGYLYEGLDFGLVYQSHTERENLAAALELDYTTPGHVAPPLDPSDDDQGAINDAEVIRDGGSSSRLDSDSAPDNADPELSIQNIGRRDDSQTYSLNNDDQPYQLAGWRLHAGTVPGYRFPAVTLDLAAGPSLIADFCAADLAFLLTITNVPDDIGPDDVAVMVEGYQETLDPFGWKANLNCTLAKPYRVFELASTSSDQSDTVGRLAGDDAAALRTAIDNDDTSILLDPNFWRWTTVADDFDPNMVIRLGGETVAVSGIATTAVTFVAAGAVNQTNNAANSPTLYTGHAQNDLIVVFAALGTNGTVGTLSCSGYTRLPVFPASANVQLFAKVHGSSESNPTVTPSGGSAGDIVSAVTFGIRGTSITLDDLADIVIDAAAQFNTSAQNVAYPAIYPLQEGCFTFVVGAKRDQWTSVATLSGMTEIVDANTSTGNEQSIAVDYLIQTTPAIVPAGSFTVTGGTANVSWAAAVAIAGGFQTLTASQRSVNGVVKSHAVGTRIEVDDGKVLPL